MISLRIYNLLAYTHLSPQRLRLTSAQLTDIPPAQLGVPEVVLNV